MEEESWIVVTPMISAWILGGGGADFDPRGADFDPGGSVISLPLLFPAGPRLCGAASHQAARSPKCRFSTSVGSGVGAGIREDADGDWGASLKGRGRCGVIPV